MIERAGAAGLPVSDLTRRASVDPADAASRIEALARDASAIRVGDVLVAPAVIDALQRGVVDLLAAHHKAQPLSAGVPREEARERLFRRGAAAVFDQAVGALAARGTIVARDRLALASHRVELSPEEERARAALDRAFAAAGLTPPDAGAVAASAGLSAAVADRMLALLQRQKVLVKVDTLVFHEQTLAKLKQDVATLKTAGGGQARIDVGTFKERFGVSRKFAIPLLEYLDRERVTRRIGDARVVL
jgi:selenocysteine-specific elongation factor